MSLLGRRQPFRPIILRSGGRKSTAQVLNVQVISQQAAIYPRRPRGVSIIKVRGAPQSVARLTNVGVISQQAAIYPRRPHGEVIILRRGAPPSVARSTTVGVVSQQAAIFPRRPRGAIVLRSSLLPSQPSTARFLGVSAAQVDTIPSRPRGAVIIKGAEQYLAAYPSSARFIGTNAAIQAAVLRWGKRGAVSVESSLHIANPVAKSLVVGQSQQGNLFPWRSRGHVTIESSLTLGKAPVTTFVAPKGQAAAQAAAAFSRRPPVHTFVEMPPQGITGCVGFVPASHNARQFAQTALPFALTYNQNVQAGSLLEVTIGMFGNATVTVTDSLGQVYSQAGNYSTNGAVRVCKFYFPNTAAGACTVTITPSISVLPTVDLAEYTGVTPANPVVGTAHDAGTGANPDTGVVTISAPENLVTAAYTQGSANVAQSTVANPFLVRTAFLNGGSLQGLGTADNVNALVNEQAVFSTTTSTTWAGMAVSYRAICNTVPSAGAYISPKGGAASKAATGRAHHPLFQLILKQGGQPPPIARPLVTNRAASTQEYLERDRYKPIILRGGGPAIVAKRIEVQGAGAVREAINAFRRKPAKTNIYVAGHQAIVGTLRIISPYQAALARFTSHTRVQTFSGVQTHPLPGGPPIAGIPLIIYEQAVAAAMYYRRRQKVIINKLGARPQAGHIIFPKGQAQQAATRAYGRILHPTTLKLLGYVPFVGATKIASKPMVLTFAASASIAVHVRPYPPPIIIPIPVQPGTEPLGHSKPFLNRVPLNKGELTPEQARNLTRHTDIITSIINALFGRNELKQVAPADFTLTGLGSYVFNGAPGIANDAAHGYAVGSFWVDTATNQLYVCVSNANGAAIWKLVV
jgi:hypothetical protein